MRAKMNENRQRSDARHLRILETRRSKSIPDSDVTSNIFQDAPCVANFALDFFQTKNIEARSAANYRCNFRTGRTFRSPRNNVPAKTLDDF